MINPTATIYLSLFLDDINLLISSKVSQMASYIPTTRAIGIANSRAKITKQIVSIIAAIGIATITFMIKNIKSNIKRI